ncbi:CPXCG motif-containing cysteine-rich protein [Haloferula helveola]|uniref:CPXCG motif-containing cysteine-rich protein n=1 Tax=Haloferula helveola TaxID=490095 RepID=A0ABN6H995_9BACT|nr:CPXCG motif-containing cysteine-rich protein [Haloferula helveola]
MELCSVQCPTCFEWFDVLSPPPEELPAEVDYDCEVCCRPLVIRFDSNGATAHGLGDS